MPNDIVAKKGERTRVTRIHEEIVARSTEINATMANCLGNENLVVDLVRTNLLRNGRTLFDVHMHDGQHETSHQYMTAEEVNAFFAGIQMACGWFTYTIASHVDEAADTGNEMISETDAYDGFRYEDDPEAVAEDADSVVTDTEDTEFKQAA